MAEVTTDLQYFNNDKGGRSNPSNGPGPGPSSVTVRKGKDAPDPPTMPTPSIEIKGGLVSGNPMVTDMFMLGFPGGHWTLYASEDSIYASNGKHKLKFAMMNPGGIEQAENPNPLSDGSDKNVGISNGNTELSGRQFTTTGNQTAPSSMFSSMSSDAAQSISGLSGITNALTNGLSGLASMTPSQIKNLPVAEVSRTINATPCLPPELQKAISNLTPGGLVGIVLNLTNATQEIKDLTKKIALLLPGVPYSVLGGVLQELLDGIDSITKGINLIKNELTQGLNQILAQVQCITSIISAISSAIQNFISQLSLQGLLSTLPSDINIDTMIDQLHSLDKQLGAGLNSINNLIGSIQDIGVLVQQFESAGINSIAPILDIINKSPIDLPTYQSDAQSIAIMELLNTLNQLSAKNTNTVTPPDTTGILEPGTGTGTTGPQTTTILPTITYNNDIARYIEIVGSDSPIIIKGIEPGFGLGEVLAKLSNTPDGVESLAELVYGIRDQLDEEVEPEVALERAIRSITDYTELMKLLPTLMSMYKVSTTLNSLTQAEQVFGLTEGTLTTIGDIADLRLVLEACSGLVNALVASIIELGKSLAAQVSNVASNVPGLRKTEFNASMLLTCKASKTSADSLVNRVLTNDEWDNLIAVTYAETSADPKERAWFAGTILNRCLHSGLTVIEAINQSNEFKTVVGIPPTSVSSIKFITGPAPGTANEICAAFSEYLSSSPNNNYYFSALLEDEDCNTNNGVAIRNGIEGVLVGSMYFFPGARWP